MTWQIFPNVTFTNGSKNIAVNDSTATAGILAGYAVNKDNKSYEIESITSSAIILVDAWTEATTANVKIKIQPTSEPIKEYIQETLGEVKGLVADYLARLQLEESIISSTGIVPFTDSAGVTHNIPGWGNLESAALAKMQEFGYGGFSKRPKDFNEIPPENGLYWPAGYEGAPTNTGRTYAVFTNYNSALSGIEIAARDEVEAGLFWRGKSNGVYKGFKKIWDKSTLNQYEFGGLAQFDMLGLGFAVSSTEAAILLPILLPDDPSSITVNGAFELYDTSFNPVNTDLSTLFLSGRTNSRQLVISVQGATGLTPGDTLVLSTASSTSKITVNP